MVSILGSAPPLLLPHKKLLSLRSFTRITLTLPSTSLANPNPITLCCLALRDTGTEGAPDPALLRRPLASAPSLDGEESDGVAVEDRPPLEGRERSRRSEKEDWVDWEDKILEDTVPLVGFARTILHSGKYASGDRLSPEHEKVILERLLPYHPEFEKKIGIGIDFITVGYHPEFENSRCLFIVRKDGELVDFSYWKCIKGLIKKNYPLYADSFILRHFRRRRNTT